MNKLHLAGAFTALSLVAAQAADLSRPVYKAPEIAGPASGFYFGFGASGGATKDRVEFLSLPGIPGNGFNPTGIGIEGVIGYRAWNAGGGMIAFEAQGEYDFDRSSTSCFMGLQSCSLQNTWRASQLIKIGAPLAVMTGQIPVPARPLSVQAPPFLVPNALPTTLGASAIIPYLAGGVSERRLSGCVDGLGTQGCSQTWFVGWSAGGGITLAAAQGVDLDLSVLYTSWNKSFAPGNPMFPLAAGTFNAQNEVRGQVALIFHTPPTFGVWK